MASADPVTTFQRPKELLEFLDKSGLVVLEFMAPWSAPSMAMEQPYKEVATDLRPKKNIEFAAVPFNKFQNLAQKLGVDAMPVFLLMDRRTVKDRFVALSKKELAEKIDKMLDKYQPK